MGTKEKKWYLLAIGILSLLAFYTLTGSKSGLLTNLPFGGELILVVNVMVITIVLGLMLDLMTDSFNDEIEDLDGKLASKALFTSEGSGLLAMARSIRFLGIALIAYGVIQVYG